MYYKEKQITLKDGRTAVLRIPARSDARQMLDFIRTCCSETDFLLSSPDEFSLTVEEEADFLEKNALGENSVMIVCTVGNEIAGDCSVQFNRHRRTKHRASLGITVLKKYWRLGIGQAMMNEIIGAARDRGVELLELEFVEGNDRARALYEKLGFVITGEKEDAIRLDSGASRKLFSMTKHLGDSL